jgi:hypothetical protein
MDYLEWKRLHILSSTLLFGTGIGTAFSMFYANRSGDVRAIAIVARNVVRADWLFTLPAINIPADLRLLHDAARGHPAADIVDLDFIRAVPARRPLLVAGRLAADPHARHSA